MTTDIRRRTYHVAESKLSVLTAGPPDGAPVLLVHGVPAGAELWRGGFEPLCAAGFRVLAPDLPGYGGTRLPPEGDRSLPGAAALLAAWLRQEQLPPLWLVGHDLGGLVAQFMAVRTPELIARLTLADSPIEDSWPVTPVRYLKRLAQWRLLRLAASLGLSNVDSFFRSYLRKGFSHPEALQTDDTLHRVFYDSKIHDPAGRREFAAHLRTLDNRAAWEVARELPQVPMPVQLLWGRDDCYQPWETVGARFRELLPQAQVDVIDDAGHFAMLDQPTAFYERLIAWGTSGGTGAG